MSRLSAVSIALLMVVGCGSPDVASTPEPVDEIGSSTTVTSVVAPSTKSTSMTLAASTSTTTVATTTATQPGTPLDRGVVLEPDGLGIVQFGEPLEEVIKELALALGPPTLAEEVEPNTPSNTEFHAYWSDAGLHIGFSTYPFFREDGQLHFTWWHTWLPHDGENPVDTPPANPVKTAEGIGWGSTMRDLLDAYGDRFWINTDECAPPGMIAPHGDVPGEARDADGHPRWIGVSFDQGIDDPDSTPVSGMQAGASDGC